MKITPITELPQRFQRFFRTTTPRSSNVGRPGFEQRENWQPLSVAVPHLFCRKSLRRTRLEEIALFVEADLRSPEYVNGMYYEPIDEDKFSLWCQIQALKADCPRMTYGEAAKRLGLSRWTAYRALLTLHRHIRRETYRIAASLDYL